MLWQMPHLSMAYSIGVLSTAGRNWKAIVQDIGSRTVAQVTAAASHSRTVRQSQCHSSLQSSGQSKPRVFPMQVRSHAQKYFLRLEKEGRATEIPQPRPKKRAAHPYPVQARTAYAFQTQPPAPLKARKSTRGELAILSSESARPRYMTQPVLTWR